MSDRRVTCEQFRELLDDYFDERLPDRPAFDAHAGTCPDCRAALASLTEELADLPCQTFVELVTDYLERSMDGSDWARMNRHLELCEGCRAYLRQMRLTIELTAGPPAEPPDPHLRETLVAAFRAARDAR